MVMNNPHSDASSCSTSEAFLYKWYIEHYTGLDEEDIAKIKLAWDTNPSLKNDPNIRDRKRNKE
jgi:hypothetical protein